MRCGIHYGKNTCTSIFKLSPQYYKINDPSCLGCTRRHRSSSSRSFHSSLSPHSNSNPALRSISVPHHFQQQHHEALSAEVLKKRAEKALLLQLQQEVLWEGSVVNDPQHHLISHFEQLLRNPKYRSTRRMMAVGGGKMIEELCHQGSSPKHLLISDGLEIPKWASDRSIEVVRVSQAAGSVCFAGNDGYIGDFRIPDPPPKEALIANKQRLERVVVLDNVDDPGNLGTILRTAAGFHYDAIILTNHSADLFDQRVIRAARGAHFQNAVPIYALQEENGDDVTGMINHIIQRNNMEPVFMMAKPDEENFSGHRRFPSSILPKNAETSTEHTMVRQMTVHNYCSNKFSSFTEETESDSIMLFLSPNHKGNTQRRLSQRLSRRAITLQLDYPVEDYLVASSVALHALRPSGNWDYLPLDKQSEPSTLSLQTRKAFVDIGPDRLVLGEKDLSLDEHEQIEEAHLRNEYTKWRRLQKRAKSDYDHWMDSEVQRINNSMKQHKKQLQSPWQPQQKVQQRSPPEWVPNIIDEYRQSPDRNYFRAEKEDSEGYVRPSNYEK